MGSLEKKIVTAHKQLEKRFETKMELLNRNVLALEKIGEQEDTNIQII